MTTLSFTDPREVAVYIDRFEDRSISPLQAYLWENADDEENRVITRVRREELDWMVIDVDKDRLVIDSAIYVVHQKNDDYQNVLILGHVQDENSGNPWETAVLVYVQDKIAAENLAKQILGEARLAFSVVESS